MSTQAQVLANQANAQHSTGPKTEQGKAAAAHNNFRHGFTGAFLILGWEKQGEFNALLAGLREEHQPTTTTEAALVDKMAQALWLANRASLFQHLTFNPEVSTCDDEKQLALYLRYQTTHDRAFQTCLTQLLKLRAERRKAEIGFESQQRRERQERGRQQQEMRREAGHLRREAAEKRKEELHKWNVLLAQAKVDNQELHNMRLETPEHRIHGRVERVLAAERAA